MSLLSKAIYKAQNNEYLSSMEYDELLKWGKISGGTGKEACDAIATALSNGGKPFELVNRQYYEEERLAKLGTPQSSGGCFLTTACMHHMGQDFEDDCEELSVLRTFRDTFVKDNHPEAINYYYEVAPEIVKVIEEKENSNEIFKKIHSELVLPCVKYINGKCFQSAYQLYRDYTLSLEIEYC